MLYIGGIYGGPEGTRVGSAISKLKRLRGDEQIKNSGSLDVVFHVPGSIVSPDYEGVRTAIFSKKRRLLQVQVGVPPDLDRLDQCEIEQFLLSSLREAVQIAQPVFDKAKIPYQRDEYERLLDRIARALSAN